MGKTSLAKRRQSLSVSGPGDSQVPPTRSRSDARHPSAGPSSDPRRVTPMHSDLQSACHVCRPPSSDRRASQPAPSMQVRCAPINRFRGPQLLQLRSAIRLPRKPQLRSARHPCSPANPRLRSACHPASPACSLFLGENLVWGKVFSMIHGGSVKNTPEGAYEVTTHSWSWCHHRTPTKPPPHYYPSRALPQPFTSIMYSQDPSSHYKR